MDKKRLQRVEELLSKGQDLLEAGYPDWAQDCFDEAGRLASGDDSNQHHARRISQEGWGLFKQRKFDEALSCFSQAIKWEPDYFGHYNYYGVAFLSLGDFKEAVRDFTATIIISDGQESSAWANRGVCFLGLKRLDEALGDLNKAVEISPRECSYHIQRGLVLYYMERFNDALADYLVASKINPAANHYLSYLKSLARYYLRDFDGALADIELAISLQPSNKQYLEWHTVALDAVDQQNDFSFSPVDRYCPNGGKTLQ